MRAELGLMQDDLAKRADINYTTLNKVESGVVNKSSIQPMAKIAKALSVSIEDLIKYLMKKFTYKKYSREDQRSLATWAADCAERVLPFFEKAYPEDDRPRKAIEACRTWVRTGVFKMADIRGASLAAHAAAREAKENNIACFAARAAGQAVATAHVPQHAYGSAYYALKAVAVSDPANAEVKIAKERNWQSQHLPENLRQEIMGRIIILKNGHGIRIKIQKGEGF